MSDTELVEVVAVTVYLPVPGRDGQPAMLHYTVRPGDTLVMKPGVVEIHFASKEVKLRNEVRSLPGKRVTLVAANCVSIEQESRLEPKTRPSAASLRNREQAELDELKSKLLES